MVQRWAADAVPTVVVTCDREVTVRIDGCSAISNLSVRESRDPGVSRRLALVAVELMRACYDASLDLPAVIESASTARPVATSPSAPTQPASASGSIGALALVGVAGDFRGSGGRIMVSWRSRKRFEIVGDVAVHAGTADASLGVVRALDVSVGVYGLRRRGLWAAGLGLRAGIASLEGRPGDSRTVTGRRGAAAWAGPAATLQLSLPFGLINAECSIDAGAMVIPPRAVADGATDVTRGRVWITGSAGASIRF